jgi:hypothetical protein
MTSFDELNHRGGLAKRAKRREARKEPPEPRWTGLRRRLAKLLRRRRREERHLTAAYDRDRATLARLERVK